MEEATRFWIPKQMQTRKQKDNKTKEIEGSNRHAGKLGSWEHI